MNVSFKGITLILQEDELHPYTFHAVQWITGVGMIWNPILSIWEI